MAFALVGERKVWQTVGMILVVLLVIGATALAIWLAVTGGYTQHWPPPTLD